MIPLTLAGLLGSALMAGVFFAFSTFVMRALAELPAGQGIAAMQRINRAVLNPWFLGAFMGTAAVSATLAAAAILRWQAAASPGLLAGAALYLAGGFGVTVRGNVPMNDRLAAMDPAGPDAQRYWRRYLVRWTRWNHLRTAAACLAVLAFAVALYGLGR
mgnify:CR=1 FL=1